jgi:pimeloyl-ACP methyl ester carboxylesterase
VATFALIHGGGTSWDWHLGSSELREHGHEPVAIDLPSEDDCAGWWKYADTVVQAVGDRSDLVVVGHSLGGFTAPLVCARVPAELLVLVAAMIPSPGELFADWWTNAAYEESSHEDVFYHDVPPALAAEARRRERGENSKALREPWPLKAWPDVPTRYLLCRGRRTVRLRSGGPVANLTSRLSTHADGGQILIGPRRCHRRSPEARNAQLFLARLRETRGGSSDCFG